jgi:hypothetical protein
MINLSVKIIPLNKKKELKCKIIQHLKIKSVWSQKYYFENKMVE